MAVTQGLTRDLRRLIPPRPLHIDNCHLAAGGPAKTVTVPPGASFCFFSTTPSAVAGYEFLARFGGGTATLPVGDVTDGSASFPNPDRLAVTPGETFSLIATTNGDIEVAMAYYGKDEVGW